MTNIIIEDIDSICRKFNAPTLSQYLDSTGELYTIAAFDNDNNISLMDSEK